MAFKYGNFLTSPLTAGIADDATSVPIDSGKRAEFSSLVDGDEDAVLVISEEISGSPTKFEIVLATGTSGNNIEVTRAQEGTDAQDFTSNAKITNVLTAERAALLGGTANLDIMPDIDVSKKLGEKGKSFSEVHAASLAVKADSQEYVIKRPAVVSGTGDMDLFLPKDTGTLARLEDSVEAHPGCFSGSLCVEPAAEEVMNAVARGHSDIGDGIHIVAHYTSEGQQRLKLAKYGGDGGTLVAALGLEIVPGTGGDNEDPARYRRQIITVDGNEYNYLDVEYKIIGDFETVDGDIPSGFSQELVGTWLENITFTRQPPGLFVAQKVYGQDISADNIDAENIDGTNLTSSLNMKLPVLAVSPGVDHDTTEGYEVGSVVYSSLRQMTYVCIDATEGAAKWRPAGFINASSFVLLFSRSTEGGEGYAALRERYTATITTPDLTAHNRFYVGFMTSGVPSAPIDGIGGLASVVADYDDFESDGISTPGGALEITRVSDTSVELVFEGGRRGFEGRDYVTWANVRFYGD